MGATATVRKLAHGVRGAARRADSGCAAKVRELRLLAADGCARPEQLAREAPPRRPTAAVAHEGAAANAMAQARETVCPTPELVVFDDNSNSGVAGQRVGYIINTPQPAQPS